MPNLEDYQDEAQAGLPLQGSSQQSLGGSPMEQQAPQQSPMQQQNPQQANLDRMRQRAESPVRRFMGGLGGRNFEAEYQNALVKSQQQEAVINHMNAQSQYLKDQSVVHGVTLLGQLSNMSPEVADAALPAISALLGHGTDGHALMDPKMLKIIGSGGQQYVQQMVARFPILTAHPEVAPELQAAVRAAKGNPEAINTSLKAISDRLLMNLKDSAGAKLRMLPSQYQKGQPLPDWDNAAMQAKLTNEEVHAVTTLSGEGVLKDDWFTLNGVKSPSMVAAEQKAGMEARPNPAELGIKNQAELEHTTPGQPYFGKLPTGSLARQQRENDLRKQQVVPGGGDVRGRGTGLQSPTPATPTPGGPLPASDQVSQDQFTQDMQKAGKSPAEIAQAWNDLQNKPGTDVTLPPTGGKPVPPNASLPSGSLATRETLPTGTEINKRGDVNAYIKLVEQAADQAEEWAKKHTTGQKFSAQGKITGGDLPIVGPYAKIAAPLDPETADLQAKIGRLTTMWEKDEGGVRSVSNTQAQARMQGIHGGTVTNPNLSINLRGLASDMRESLAQQDRAAGGSDRKKMPGPEAPSGPKLPANAHKEGNDIVSDDGKYIWKDKKWQKR